MATKNLAAKANYSLSPGEDIPSDSNVKPEDPVSSAPSNGTNTDSDDSDDNGGGLAPGAIAGIVVGGVAALALVGLLFFLVGRKKKAAEITENKDGAVGGYPAHVINDAETGAAGGVAEHPPMYDPRYSQQIPPASPTRPWSEANIKHGHVSMMSEDFNMQNPNRMSELPSQNYDPVEIYTPGLPQHHDLPSPIQEGQEADSPRDTRRDTVG